MPIIKGTSSRPKKIKPPAPPEGQAGRAGRSTGSTTYDAPDKSGASLATPRGARVSAGETKLPSVKTVSRSKQLSAKTTKNAIKGTGSFGGGDGGGARTGKWAQGATGRWERAGNTYGGGGRTAGGGGITSPRAGGGGGGRAGGGMSAVAATAGSSEANRNRPPGAAGNSFAGTALEDTGYGGGGGGTGNPLAGVSSALKATSIKGSKIEGMSVEEAVKGARRTRKTGGQQRSQ